MGFNLSWIAVKGITPDQALAELKFVNTRASAGDFDGAPLTGAMLASGWYLIVSTGWASPWMNERVLLNLSQRADVLSCVLSETVMNSSAKGFRGGARQWEIFHDPAEGITNIQVSGTPPECFAEIRDRLLEKQRTGEPDVDYVFNVPIEVLQSLTGFRHNRVSSGNIEPFMALEQE